MRMSKLLLAGLTAALGSLCLSSIASGAVVDQRLTVNAIPTKHTNKQRGKIQVRVDVDTDYDAPPSANFTPPANRTVIDFDKDFFFNPGKLATCSAASLAGQTAANARATCPGAVVGGGNATIRSQLGATIPAEVSAFNGERQNGAPVILLHTDPQGVATKPILTGVLTRSPVPGFGQRLDVTVPVTPGTVITHFDTTIRKITSKVKKKKNKKTGKVKKIKTFYAAARCTDGSWVHSETTTFNDGSSKTDLSTAQFCQKKKIKKKKKKKK